MIKLLTGVRWFILLLVLAVSFMLMLNAARGDSAIRGELIFDLENFLWFRIISIAFALILSLSIYLWSKELIGRWWALLAVLLFSFSPIVLAYGHFFSMDIFAAFGAFASVFTFLNFLNSPSRKNLLFASLAFGLAQFLKFSNVFLVPYFLFLIIVFYITSVIRDWAATAPSGRFHRFKTRAIRYFRSVIIIFFIGFLVIFTLGILKEKDFIRPITGYLSALTSYLKLKGSGTQILTLFLVKEPLPLLVLIAFSVVIFLLGLIKIIWCAIFQKLKLSDYLSTHFIEFSMIIFIIANFSINILKEPLNSANYLAILPFIYIVSASAIKSWFTIPGFNLIRNFLFQVLVASRHLWQITIKSALLATVLIWYLAAVFIVSPNFLSYFNYLDRLFKQTTKYLIQFDYDRGQDLRRLATWAEKEEIDNIAVDYFGIGNPKMYLGNKANIWQSELGNPKENKFDWLAVSLVKKKDYSWLEKIPVYTKIGETIFVYNL